MSAPTAAVFPGQGSQKPGMAADFYESFDECRAAFDEASEALGYDVAALCFERPASSVSTRLDMTEFTQPAILTAEIAMLRALATRRGLAPTWFAGHSLGEYTALVAAGVLPLAEAVRVVAERGRAMQCAVPVGEGAMAALIGAPLPVQTVCAAVSDLVVDLANLNSPDQVVLSGAAADMETALDRIAADPGTRHLRAVRLPVSAPFHSRLMAPIEPAFRAVLEASAPTWACERAAAVASNTTGTFHTGDRTDLVEALAGQVSGSVRWVDNMAALHDQRPARIVEIGPSRPLRGFFRAIGLAIEGVSNLRMAERLGA